MNQITEDAQVEIPGQMAYPTIKQGWGVIGLFILITLIYGFPIGILSLVGVKIESGPFLLLNYSIPLILLIFVTRSWWNKNPKNGGTLKLKSFPLAILPVVIIMSFAFILINSEITSWVPMPDFLVELFESMMEVSIWGFLTIAVAAAVLEEVLMRGIVLEGLLRNYNPWKAIIWSSLFFGILHLNPWQFVAAFLVGLGIGYLYWKTRSLWLCMLIHFINNATGYVLYMKYPDAKGVFDIFEMGLAGRVLVFLVAGLVLWGSYQFFERYFKTRVRE